MSVIKLVEFPIAKLSKRKTLPFDIYISAAGKPICVGKRGDLVYQEQFDRYLKKNVFTVLVHQEDVAEFSRKTRQAAQGLLESTRLDNATKVAVMGKLTEKVFDDLTESGFKNDALSFANQVVKNQVNMLEKNDNLLEVLDNVGLIEDPLMAHCMAVSAISVMIAKSQGWINTENYEKVSLGGLLHDVGVKLLPLELQSKSRTQMTPTDFKKYRAHPTEGSKVLTGLNLPEEIMEIIQNHHEYDGKGYPRGLNNNVIHALVRLVSLADQFSYLILKTDLNPNPISINMAFQKLRNQKLGSYRLAEISNLEKLFRESQAA